MRKKSEISDSLIGKYLEGGLNQKDSSQFEAWINENGNNKQIFMEYMNIWELSHDIKELESIDMVQARKAVNHKLKGFHGRRRLTSILQRAAAILFIPLLVSSIGYVIYSLPAESEFAAKSNLNVSFGTVAELVLSDGTRVWLNSGSHMEYPTQFKGSEREVYLEGQAYFEVAKSQKPFVVSTSDIEIRALGTSFDVIAYPEDNRIQTTLIEGKVVLYRRMPDSKPSFLKEMVPDERAVYSTAENNLSVKRNADTEKITSWKDGKLIFKNDSFEEVVWKLSKWYNTDIRLVDSELKSYRYTATFVDESLWQVLELLKKTAPITYESSIRNKKPNGTYEKRTVEIHLRE
ncbi:MAG: FecR domain-containing protein [Bacteroidota bacterium]